MDFDPPVSTWTDDQLDDSRKELVETLNVMVSTWGEDAVFTSSLKLYIDTIDREILERGLKLVDGRN